MANEEIFRRYSGNPIVGPNDLPGANSIFNSAVLKYGKGYVGVFRVDMQEEAHELHTGWSDDGINWRVEPNRINITGAVPKGKPAGSGYDPRVAKIGNTYYVTWCYYPESSGPCIGLGATKDFRKYKQLATVMFPFNRNAVLFPRKINGKFAILHRPSDTGHTPFGDMFFADSPDLISWGNHKFVFGPRGWWQGSKVGAGPVPIETKDGWLVIYHGVRITCSGYVYCAGAALLDLKQPWKVMYRTKRYLLAPTESYETTGDVPNVVFPNAAIVDEKSGRLDLYYGCADTCVGLAQAQLSDVIRFVKKNSF